jgi:hypothetical protein
VDGAPAGTLTFPALPGWDTWATATLTTSLTPGPHTVTIAYAPGDTGGINLDNLVVARP